MRITAGLLNFIKDDLARPHPFAWERVGFMFCSSAYGGQLLLASSYQVIADEMYLPDPYVGARFDGNSIRRARQYSLETGQSIIHIHAHEGRGSPRFSPTDMSSLVELVPSFMAVAPSVPHGAVVLSDNCAYGLIWKRGNQFGAIQSIRKIGFHLSTLTEEIGNVR